MGSRFVQGAVPSTRQADALLRFLPAFRRQGFWFERVIWESGQISYIEKSPEAEMFLRTLKENGWILPPGSWQTETETWLQASDRVRSADFDGLQRLFTSWLERDRLLPGHLGAVYERGDLTAALERLERLRPRLDTSVEAPGRGPDLLNARDRS